MFYKCKKQGVFIGACVAFLFCSGFKVLTRSQDLRWAENYIRSCFDDQNGSTRLKKWDLSITENGFFRLKKNYLNGKQEYFSFNLKKLSDLQYQGTEESGEIVLKTKSDDVIVQTYNDPKGNIDSMSDALKIPVIHVQKEMLDSLRLTLSDSLNRK